MAKNNENIDESIKSAYETLEYFKSQTEVYNRLKSSLDDDINNLTSKYYNLVTKGGEEELKSVTNIGKQLELQKRKVSASVEYYRNTKRIKKAEEENKKILKKAEEERAKGNLKVSKLLLNEAKVREININKQKFSNNLLAESLGGYKNLGGLFSKFNIFLGGALTILKGVKKIFNFFIGDPFKIFLKMQEITGNLAANTGLALGYTIDLQDNFSEMTLAAMAYGSSMEDVSKIISEYSKTTGRNRLFTTNDIEDITRIGNSLNLGSQGISNIVAQFDIMNVSISRTTDLLDYSMERSAKLSLNGSKVVEDTTKLLKSFKGFNFQNGLNDLTDMVTKSQTLRFNLDNMKSLSDELFNIENAVEMSAQLRVLGGNAAAIADPFKLMYQGMSDQAGLLDSITQSVANLATKNPDGLFTVPPASRAIIRDIAKTLGQNPDELMNVALEQAKMMDKMNSLNYSFLDSDDKKVLANMMTMNDDFGGYAVYVDGVMKDVRTLSKSSMNNILEQAKVNESAARGRENFIKRLRGYGERFQMAMSNLFLPFYDIFDRDNGLEQSISKAISELTQTMSNALKKLLGDGSDISTVIKSATKGISYAIDNIARFIDEMRGNGSFWTQIKNIMFATFDEMKPAIKYAMSELATAIIGDSNFGIRNMLFGGLADMKHDTDVIDFSNRMNEADDFIYSNKHGLTKFRKDDLVLGGTNLTQNQTNNNNVTTPNEINLNINGTLKVESKDNSYTFTKNELKDIGLTQLTKLIIAEMDKINRGTFKNTPNLKVKPING